MLWWHKVRFRWKQFLGIDSSLEAIIKLPTNNINLYNQAFSHVGNGEGYERLEFLGDSVLQTITSEFLYNNYKDLAEGKLTQIRSSLVRRSALNLLGYRIGLGELIQSDFLTFETLNQTNERIFGDTLESLIGAVYLDHGYKGAYHFVINVLLKRYVKLDVLKESATNHKGILMELSQKMSFKIQYDLIENKPDRNKVILSINNKPVATASAKTKKKAEQKAAKKVLNSPQLESIIGKL